MTPADRQTAGHAVTPRRDSPARPADVIRDLVTLLRGRGLVRLYWSGCAIFAVLSVTQGLTVWCDGWHLTWRDVGIPITWLASDTHGAAEHLAQLARPQQ
jgi:hypothetical protein